MEEIGMENHSSKELGCADGSAQKGEVSIHGSKLTQEFYGRVEKMVQALNVEEESEDIIFEREVKASVNGIQEKTDSNFEKELNGSEQESEIGIPQLESFTEVYQLRLNVLGTRPPIWRRIQVPASYTFFDLHVAIQDTMQDWIDLYEHNFNLPDGSIVKYAEQTWNTRSGWTTKIRDHLTIGDTISLDSRVVGKRRNSSRCIPADTLTFEENSIDLPFHTKRPRKYPQNLGTLEAQKTITNPVDEEDPFSRADVSGNAASPVRSMPSGASSPTNTESKMLPPLPASPNSCAGLAIDEQLFKGEVQERELEQDAMEAAEVLLCLSSCSDSSGMSQPSSNAIEIATNEEPLLSSVPCVKTSKKDKSCVSTKAQPKCIYTYDLVDNWQISIVLEQILPRVLSRVYPICTGGKRRGPPENSGGVRDFNLFVRATLNLEKHFSDTSFVPDETYNPAAFHFKNVVFRDPRRLMFEAMESVRSPATLQSL